MRRIASSFQLFPLNPHPSHSGNTAKAVYYLQQAEQRSACAEAISHVTTALELLPSLTDTPERIQQELLLQI
jgi:hypothetical protein